MNGSAQVPDLGQIVDIVVDIPGAAGLVVLLVQLGLASLGARDDPSRG
jgi:hypothetical protein